MKRIERIIKKEKQDYPNQKIICDCGNDTWKVYFKHVPDDERLYCVKCGKPFFGDYYDIQWVNCNEG